MYWDTSVASHEKYDGADVANIVSSTKVKGGGGTDPTCVPKFLAQENIKPECVVMLTDGEIWGNAWGEWDSPVLWVITNKNIVSPVGQTINIKEVA